MNLIEKSNDVIYKIQKQLQNNKNITRLLYYSNTTPLDVALAEVPADKIKELIVANPVVDYNKSDVSHFISIGIPLIDFANNGDTSVIKLTISVVCSSDYWELDNNQVRIMSVVNEMYNELQNTKYAFSGALIIDTLEPIIYSDNLVGYQVQCYMIDQQNENDIN
jgi:hypothetical protein